MYVCHVPEFEAKPESAAGALEDARSPTMPQWAPEDDDAIAAAAAARTGSAWPATVSLPVRGTIEGRKATQRWALTSNG